MVHPELGQGSGTVRSLPRPRSPIRIDWASFHSNSRASSEESRHQDRDVYKTPPPKHAELAQPIGNDHISVVEPIVETAWMSSRIYDIPTLLKYRGSLAGIGVFAKIKPDALRENLFQFVSAPRPVKAHTRIRTLSEISNRSRRTLVPAQSENVNKGNGYLPRMTHLPSTNHVLQQSEGFARFLKQHASPPHHRVTAGGRIVPTGPHSPPPMFDYESLTGLMSNRRPNGPANHVHPQMPVIREPGPQNGFQFPQPSIFNGSARTLDEYLPMNMGQQDIQTTPQMPPGLTQPILNAFSIPPAALVPLGAFEDGSIMASCNGVYYRTFWNGVSTVIEPISITSASSSTAYQNNVQPRTSQNQPPSSIPQFSHQQSVPMPLANSTNRSRVSSSTSQAPKNGKALEAQQQSLRTSLQTLDRHLALHHYELSNEQKSSYISQRKSLVEEIDKIRRIKEPTSENLPPVNVKDLARRATDRIKHSRSSHHSGAVENKPNTTNLKDTKAGDVPKKGLSPDAPPFVPGSIRSAALARSSNGLERSKLGSRRVSIKPDRGHKQDVSLDKDPLDPAMRVIHNSDVAYASKYEDLRLDGKKPYCTKVSEFQEALRQVRQQARLYGCAGGSSKDPAYDAEQDIWWAICDKDPIPLPSDEPDYVRNPRPWDWNDSVFNDRRPKSNFHLPSAAPKEVEKSATTLEHDDVGSSPIVGRNLELPQGKPSKHFTGSGISNKKGTEDELSSKRFVARDSMPLVQQRRFTALSKQMKSLSESDAGLVRESAKDGRTVTRTPLQPQSNVSPAQGPRKRVPSKMVEDAHKPTLPSTPKNTEPHIPQRDASTKQNSGTASDLPVPAKITNTNGKSSVRGPRKARSKQSLTNTTPLRRHRQLLKPFSSEKKAAMATSHEPVSVNAETSIDPAPQTPPDDSSDTGRRSLIAKTTQQLSPRAAARRVMQYYDRSRSKSPLKPKHSASQLRPNRPYVKLPTIATSNLRSKIKPSATVPSEVKAVPITSPTKDSFLRDMLRAKRYSTHLHSRSTSPTKPKVSSQTESIMEDSNVVEANKENEPSQRLSGTTIAETASNPMAPQVNDDRGLLSSKAQSSLAASSFHATGFLPQFDGAGRAQTSNVHQQQALPSLQRAAKVNQPQASISDVRTSTSDLSDQTTRSKTNGSQSQQQARPFFGLDGSGDEPPPCDDRALSREEKGKDKETQTQGLTEEEYVRQRPDPNNQEHFKEVDQFFSKVAKEENQYITEWQEQRDTQGK